MVNKQKKKGLFLKNMVDKCLSFIRGRLLFVLGERILVSSGSGGIASTSSIGGTHAPICVAWLKIDCYYFPYDVVVCLSLCYLSISQQAIQIA